MCVQDFATVGSWAPLKETPNEFTRQIMVSCPLIHAQMPSQGSLTHGYSHADFGAWHGIVCVCMHYVGLSSLITRGMDMWTCGRESLYACVRVHKMTCCMYVCVCPVQLEKLKESKGIRRDDD